MNLLGILRKFSKILSKHQIVRIIELGLMMVVAGFMEMLSVSLIVPFMEAVMEPDEVMQNELVKTVCNLFGIEMYRTFLVFLAILMAILYVLKNIFLLIQMYIQKRFVFRNQFATQCILLKSYLSRPYEYYLSASSSEIIRVIISDTREAYFLLSNILMLFSEMIVSLALVATVFVIAPVITAGMSVLLLVIVAMILKIIRPIVYKAGKQNQVSYSGMQNWLLQSIEGIKEVKVMQSEDFFEKQFEKHGMVYARSTNINEILSNTPRFLIEASSMASFFLVVAFMLYKGTPLEDIVPVLSAVALAAIRLLPSVNRISSSMSSMAYLESKLDKMIENLRDVKKFEKIELKEPARIDNTFNSLCLSDLSFCYPTGDSDVLSHVDLEIKAGQSVGIIGTTGSGKTTAIDIMLGLLNPQGGKVLVNGENIYENLENWLNMLSYIPQNIFMLDGSIRENIAFGIPESEISDDKVWEAIKEAELEEFINSLSNGINTQIGERGIRLSGGQRQRIGIARALYKDPDVLFFDEATSALDTETENAIISSIEHLHGNKTLIIIAHRLSTIEHCDAVYKVDKKSIIRER